MMDSGKYVPAKNIYRSQGSIQTGLGTYEQLEVPRTQSSADGVNLDQGDTYEDDGISLKELPLAQDPLGPEGSKQAETVPALQNMVEKAVRLVSTLNFMKVELGEYKSLRSREQWRAAGAEFIATLLFVYLGCGSVVATGDAASLGEGMTGGRLVAIAVAHGLAIAFLAGATGAISGGHINPAVTLAFVVAGKETLLRAALYVIAQLLGAVVGACLLVSSVPDTWEEFTYGSHDLGQNVSPGQGLLVEIILSVVLVFVIFGVAVDRRGPGVIAPIPIGFAVVVDHLVGVPFTGASMNPARSFRPALVTGQWGRAHYIYWLGPCLGAALAAGIYRYIFLQTPPPSSDSSGKSGRVMPL